MHNLALWLDRQVKATASGLSFLSANIANRSLHWTEGQVGTAIGIVALIYIVGVGMMDIAAVNGLDFTFFYLVGCAFAGWTAGARATVLTAIVAGVFSFCGDSGSVGVSHRGWILFWNSTVNLMAFMAVSLLAAEAGRLTRGLERTVRHRTSRLESEAEQHKQTSLRLEETLQLFQQLTDNIAEVFWVTDVAGTRFSYVSPEFEKVWGMARKDVYSSPTAWLAAIHLEDRGRIMDAIRTRQATGEYDEEFRVVRPDGSVRWVHERAFPVKNERGEIYRIVGIAEDITERRKADETLRTQARVLESMAEAVLMASCWARARRIALTSRCGRCFKT